MNIVQFCIGTGIFLLMHAMIWFSMNLQFVSEEWKARSLIISIAISIPITLLSYYGTRILYSTLEESLWAVRFIAFGTSYLIFPILTWVLLKESMMTPKTLVCVLLSLIIVSIQVFWKSG